MMRRLRLDPGRHAHPVHAAAAVQFPDLGAPVGAVGRRCSSSSARNYGIDFRGGTLHRDQADQRSGRPRRPSARRSTGLSLGDVQVQEVSDIDGGHQHPRSASSSRRAARRRSRRPSARSARRSATRSNSAASRSSDRASRANSPSTASLGMVVALVGILIYVWFRFEWQFAVGAIISTAARSADDARLLHRRSSSSSTCPASRRS